MKGDFRSGLARSGKCFWKSESSGSLGGLGVADLLEPEFAILDRQYRGSGHPGRRSWATLDGWIP